jgi:hypothetical protein
MELIAEVIASIFQILVELSLQIAADGDGLGHRRAFRAGGRFSTHDRAP